MLCLFIFYLMLSVPLQFMCVFYYLVCLNVLIVVNLIILVRNILVVLKKKNAFK